MAPALEYLQVNLSLIISTFPLSTARNTGGHLGINKTCEKITSCFYWPGIKSDVIDYIKGCERCQRVNRSALQKSSLELYNIPIPIKVMSQVGIDLMKLCETDGFEDEAGFQYVITASGFHRGRN